jgi:hypothetical protein
MSKASSNVEMAQRIHEHGLRAFSATIDRA